MEKKWKALTGEQIDRIYMELFNTDSGKLVLEDLKQRCYYYLPTINIDGFNDATVTGYREGCRSVVMGIETRLKPKEE